MFKREPLHDEPLSDQLRELRRQGDGFRLPDNYLNELRDRLPATEQPSTAGVRSLYPRKTWLAIAASVALLLTLGWAWFYQPATPGSLEETTLAEVNLDVLSDDDILAYVEEHIGEFELTLLSENETEASTTAADELTETFSDEDLDALYYELVEEE